MKKRELERELKSLGWWMQRQGSKHEIWTNGSEEEAVPRHREIAETLARKIIKTARKYRGQKR
jgi:mRNA interferase HicA